MTVPEVERLQSKALRRLTTLSGGGRIVWHQWGSALPGEPPVVLFHGGSGSWTHWLLNIEPLVAAGRQVLAVDLPGFGDSDPPPSGGDADALVDPLAQGLRELVGSQPVDLVGFSFGGMTAGLLAAGHPGVARQLVLVGAPAMGVVPQRQIELKAWRHLPTLQEQEAVHRYNLAELMLHDPRRIDGLALALHTRNLARDRMPRRRLAHTDILARSLPAVRCPVSAIYGAHDALYRQWIAQLQQAFESVVPDFRGLRLIEGAGHWVLFEAPEAFDAALLAVLESGGGPPAPKTRAHPEGGA